MMKLECLCANQHRKEPNKRRTSKLSYSLVLNSFLRSLYHDLTIKRPATLSVWQAKRIKFWKEFSTFLIGKLNTQLHDKLLSLYRWKQKNNWNCATLTKAFCNQYSGNIGEIKAVFLQHYKLVSPNHNYYKMPCHVLK